MVENYTLTESDIATVGFYPESSKGTPITNVKYKPLRGILKKITWGIDDEREEHRRDGDGPMESIQTWGLRKIDGSFQYLPSRDFDSDDTVVLSMIAYAMGKNSLEDVSGLVLSRGQKYIAFDAGTAAFTVGDTLEGGTSAATARITRVLLVSGTWGTNDAAGYILLTQINGDFQTNETITGGVGGSADADEANTEIRSELDAFTLWIKEKGDINQHHVLEGMHIQKITFAGDETGLITMDINFKAMDYSPSTVGGTATLPSEPDTEGMPPFRWNKADGTVTLVRAGTNTRIDSWEFSIDNKDLKFMNKDGQRTAVDFVPLGFDIMGTLNIRLSNTTVYTLWRTDPNTTKSLPYDNRAGAGFTVNETIVGAESGASAIVIADSGTALTLKRVEGVFENEEEIEDDTGETADVNGTITDTGSLDFSLKLDKNSSNEYMKFDFLNTVPRGKFNWEYTPANDDTRRVVYPFKVLRPGNFLVDFIA